MTTDAKSPHAREFNIRKFFAEMGYPYTGSDRDRLIFIKAFQTVMGITPDGYAGLECIGALERVQDLLDAPSREFDFVLLEAAIHSAASGTNDAITESAERILDAIGGRCLPMVAGEPDTITELEFEPALAEMTDPDVAGTLTAKYWSAFAWRKWARKALDRIQKAERERDDIAKDRANAIADRDAVRAMALNGGRLANEKCQPVGKARCDGRRARRGPQAARQLPPRARRA